MAEFLVPASGDDVGDLERREGLAVARLAPVVLAAAELEDHELLVEPLADDLRLDLGAADERLAQLEAVAAEKRVRIARVVMSSGDSSSRADGGTGTEAPDRLFASAKDYRRLGYAPQHGGRRGRSPRTRQKCLGAHDTR